MAYLKPPAFTRLVFNRIAMAFGLGGSTVLAIPRRSGGTQTIPVIVAEHQGARFLVSTRGEAAWVQNLRAAGTATLRRKGTSESVRVTEIPVEERPPVLEAYRRRAGKIVDTYFAQLPDPADHPVFRVDP